MILVRPTFPRIIMFLIIISCMGCFGSTYDKASGLENCYGTCDNNESCYRNCGKWYDPTETQKGLTEVK